MPQGADRNSEDSKGKHFTIDLTRLASSKSTDWANDQEQNANRVYEGDGPGAWAELDGKPADISELLPTWTAEQVESVEGSSEELWSARWGDADHKSWTQIRLRYRDQGEFVANELWELAPKDEVWQGWPEGERKDETEVRGQTDPSRYSEEHLWLERSNELQWTVVAITQTAAGRKVEVEQSERPARRVEQCWDIEQAVCGTARYEDRRNSTLSRPVAATERSDRINATSEQDRLRRYRSRHPESKEASRTPKRRTYRKGGKRTEASVKTVTFNEWIDYF